MSLIKHLLLLLTFTFSVVHALPSDKNEKASIIADSSNYNYKTGIDIYEGNVQIDQGSTHIRADKVITKRDLQHKMKEATAYGIKKLAHYWTTPRENEMEIHATAKVIKFYPMESNVTLIKNVEIRQGDNTFHGELIHYNKLAQTITVPSSEHARAVIVYNPESSQ